MAWFSVQRELFTHPKLREVAKKIGCSQNEVGFCILRIWNWCFDNADQSGEIMSADEDDIAEAILYGLNPELSPKTVVDALIETGWIDKVDGVLYVHDWEDWQKEYYKMIDVREKNAERKRKERAKKQLKKARIAEEPEKMSDEQPMEEKLPSPKLNIPPIQESKSKPEESSYTKDFEVFWAVYPRKLGKGEAYKKYKARLNDGWKESELLEAAQTYASKCTRERTETKYIKHPKTFLSDSTPFTDYIRSKPNDTKRESDTMNEDDPFGDWRE